MNRALSVCIACCLVVTTALACERIVPETPWIKNIQLPPCGGTCAFFNSCPQGTMCQGWYLNGVKNCQQGTRTVYALRIAGGSNVGGACC